MCKSQQVLALNRELRKVGKGLKYRRIYFTADAITVS